METYPRLLSKSFKGRFSHPSRKIAFASMVLIMVLALSGCGASGKLPSAARIALEREWEELGLAWDPETQILRAWEGDLSRVSGEFSLPTMELWCVEVQYDSQLDPSAEGESMIWIVVKSDEGSAWSASILMTMSSLWAYEACGVME